MESAYLLFFKFMMNHPCMSLIINYDPVSKGVSLTMEMYPKRKRIVFLPEVIEKISLDTESIVLEYLENMYKDLDKEIRVWIKEIKEEVEYVPLNERKEK